MLRFRCSVVSPSLRRVSVEGPALSEAAALSSSAMLKASAAQMSFISQSNSINVAAAAAAGARKGPAATTSSFSRVFRTQDLPTSFKRPFLVTVPNPCSGSARTGFISQQQRMNSTSSESEKKDGEGKTEEGGEKKEGEGEGEKKEGEDGKKGKKEKEKQSFTQNFTGLKEDVTKHPDIYNLPNMMNLLLFTIFCLASTGSNVEADWWVNQWGIDGAFKPWTWALHSWMTNNLPPMAFGMMLIHSMAHSVLPHLGNAGLLKFVGITSIGSGFAMWAYNAAIGQRGGERQFGPWDVCAGLFVMQYLHQGIAPWTILSGFQSWLRYASWVGAVCTLYYNFEPTVCGTIIGFLLCKTMFKAPPIKAAA